MLRGNGCESYAFSASEALLFQERKNTLKSGKKIPYLRILFRSVNFGLEDEKHCSCWWWQNENAD